MMGHGDHYSAGNLEPGKAMSLPSDPIEPLILALYRSSDNGRRKAAEALHKRGEPGGQLSLEALIQVMQGDIIPLRRAAAGILREWGEYVPIEPLLMAMQDSDEQVRATAKWAFADIAEHLPPEKLHPLLDDADATLHEAVLYALGSHAPVAQVLEAISFPDDGLHWVEVYLVGLLGEQVPVEPLVSMLQGSEASVRATAAQALGSLGERIPIAPLVEALHDADTEVRLQAVRALANAGERMPIEELRHLLEDPELQVRHATEKALVRVGDAAALAIIVESFHADHEFERENALIRLVESTDAAKREIATHLPIEELLQLLQDEWWPVGYMSARLIAMLGEAAPFAELLALLSHPLPEARKAALYTLTRLGERIPISERIPIDLVLAALDTEDVEVRRNAAELLDYFGSDVPVDRLIPFIEDDDVQVARTIAKRGLQEGVDALVANLCNIEHYEAMRAAATLGELGAHAPAEPLLVALHHGNWSVRSAAAEALYKSHSEMLPPLVSELVETLNTGQVGPLMDPLRTVLIARALVALQSPQPALIEWLTNSLDASDWEVRMWAAIGLGQIKPFVSEETREKLRRLTQDPESASVRRSARWALEAPQPRTPDVQLE